MLLKLALAVSICAGMLSSCLPLTALGAAADPFIISEFMAANSQTLRDEDGESSDWIEIFNANEEEVSLSGWSLTDKEGNLSLWRFPDISLEGGGYLVVFASGKDRVELAGNLHTNFRLAEGGEYLALASPDGRIVSAFAPSFPPQQADISYGRDRAQPDLTGFFLEPTPGAPNATRGAGFAPDVHYSREGGTFTDEFEVVLSTSSPEATIRYTVDGSFPSFSSPAYSGPIQISRSTQVRARAYESGLLPGPASSRQYIQLAADVLNFESDLPVLIIHNYRLGSFFSDYRFSSLTVLEPQNGRTKLASKPAVSARTMMRRRGTSTFFLPKHSFTVKFMDDYSQNRDVPLLGMPADSDWVLYAVNEFDPAMIHNPFIHQLSNEIGRYSPRTRFVEVFLVTDFGHADVTAQHYNGVYVLQERVTRGKDRVDVARLRPEHQTEPEISGGYMLKVDRRNEGEEGFRPMGDYFLLADTPNERTLLLPERAPQLHYIRKYIEDFDRALQSENFADPVDGYRRYIDTSTWIDHHILNVLAFNPDALILSAYLYKERNGKLSAGPLWDFDRAFASTDDRSSDPRVWTRDVGQWRPTDFFNFDWWGRLFEDIDFWQEWVDRYQELRDGPLSLLHLHELADSLADQVREAQPRDQARWQRNLRGGFQGEVNLMKNWLAERVDFMDTNFLAKPILTRSTVPDGETLTLSGPAGAAVYYTLDGTDPRLPGGGISPNARTYSTPVTVNENTRLLARAHDPSHRNRTGPDNPPLSTSWSGVTQSTVLLQVPPLVITEIMYNPAAPPQSLALAQAFEFVELKNIGHMPLNLAGFKFTSGIQFEFPVMTVAPGGVIVVAKDPATFRSRYGDVDGLVGPYAGQLDNAGERVVLEGPLGEIIHDFRFENWWQPLADGLGYSLVAVDERAARDTWGVASQWRLSSQAGGSPGRVDSTPVLLPRVIVNELLSHTDLPEVDAVELHNPSETGADISGWFLTDDLNTPKKFRIPPGTQIPPGGFMVFSEDEFGGPEGFAFSSLGDEVHLFSADAAGELTGYTHGFRFGASPNGVTFGRQVTSDGTEHFVAQNAPSLGALNGGPRTGPLAISEVMYDPMPLPGGSENNTIDEFVEVKNITGSPVPLFDPETPTNTWRVAGGVRYTFPADLTLPAGGHLLVVSFDPATDSSIRDGFLARYGLAADTRLFGPFEGRLNNAGDTVRLLKPDKPQGPDRPSSGSVPYIVIDQVDYENGAPWPAEANRSGMSLQRLLFNVLGNEPRNWIAADPTPAQSNAVDLLKDSDSDRLPDVWEIVHGLDPSDPAGNNGAAGDPDGDGKTNHEEFLAGTDPKNAGSALRLAVTSGADGTVYMRFVAKNGRRYSAQSRANISEGSWQVFREIPSMSETRVIDFADLPEGSSRYYRVLCVEEQ